MSIEVKETYSKEFQKCKKTVKFMSKRMAFDEKMGKVNWKLVRAISNFGYRFMPKEKGVKYSKIKLDNITAIVSTPENLNNNNIIMYIHGGGFVSGSANSSKGYCSMLAKFSGCRVVAVNYSLAPEKPYPYAVDDCIKAYSILQALYQGAKFAFVGESAGANLCLATALKAKSLGLNMPSCLVVHSPFVDFSGSLDRSLHEVDDFTVKEGCLIPLTYIYVNGAESNNPFVSPIFGDFESYPSTYITCDYNETLFADSMALYEKLNENNVTVKMLQMKNAFHAFATIGSGSPETMELLNENIEFIISSFN